MSLRIAAIASLVALSGGAACSEGSAGGELALQQALATTAGRTEGKFSPRPAPLQGAAPHRLTATFELRLKGTSGERAVLVDRRVDRGSGGRFRVVDDRRAQVPELPERLDGREAVFDGARFASRRRFGPWIERDLLDGGHEETLRAAYDLGAGALAAFGDYIAWKPADNKKGADRVAGLPVRWETASLDRRVAPRPLDAAALAALRDHVEHWTAWAAATHRPTEIRGTVARTRSGEMVAGDLEIRGEATVEGVTAAFTLVVRYDVTDLPKKATFDLPAEVLPEARDRTWRMIRDVLGGDLSDRYK